jgi:hypothetical protein
MPWIRTVSLAAREPTIGCGANAAWRLSDITKPPKIGRVMLSPARHVMCDRDYGDVVDWWAPAADP